MADERKVNRLILEKSPYLLQHAYNPVDWYPWCKEAFDKAAREQKLIFLSIGYSTCHWCHVMEHESFESEEIGEILNQNFVSIKVDREERPDVDKMYMNFVQWKANRADLLEQGQQILDAIKRASAKIPDPSNVIDSRAQCALLCHNYYENTFDAMWGGFGDAPKFPQPSIFANFEFLIYHFASEEKLSLESWRSSKSLKMVDFTLNMMSKGGIHDHVAKDGASKSKKKEGAFCVWTHEEIENLLGWKKTNSDISYATIFSDFFTIKSKGNVDLVKDPHGELLNQNVLINSKPVPEICKEYDLTCDQLEQLLDESKDILYKERLTRPKPRMDTKMITSWNAMMSSAFLSAAMVLNDSKFADISLSNFNFIKRHLFEVESGQLLRCCYLDNEKKICQIAKPIYGFVDDYAHVIATALDAYRWTNDDNFVSFACRLQAKMDELFFAEFDQVAADCSKMGAYYQNSPRYESILVPLIEDHDGAEPSANSVAVLNLLRLFNLTSKEKYLEKCKQVLEYFGDKLIKFPFTLPKMMCGLLAATESSFQIVIVGSENDPHVQNMFKTVNASFLPMASVILLNDKTDSFICCQNEHVRLLKYSSTKKPVAYVCRNFACDSPAFSAEELRDKLTRS